MTGRPASPTRSIISRISQRAKSNALIRKAPHQVRLAAQKINKRPEARKDTKGKNARKDGAQSSGDQDAKPSKNSQKNKPQKSEKSDQEF